MRRAKTTMCLAKWLTLYISVCCCFKINLGEISRQRDLYKVLTRSSQGEELLSITLFTNIQMQYMTFESSIISNCSFLPLEKKIKSSSKRKCKCALNSLHTKVKISCIVASSANNLSLYRVGTTFKPSNRMWLETVFLSSFLLYSVLSKDQIHLLQSNVFHTC